MRNKSIITLFLLIVCVCTCFAADLEALLKASLNTLYADKAKPMVICFGNFTYSDKNLGSEFSRYLENHLLLALKMCPQFGNSGTCPLRSL
jgi:hypothetical protein